MVVATIILLVAVVAVAAAVAGVVAARVMALVFLPRQSARVLRRQHGRHRDDHAIGLFGIKSMIALAIWLYVGFTFACAEGFWCGLSTGAMKNRGLPFLSSLLLLI